MGGLNSDQGQLFYELRVGNDPRRSPCTEDQCFRSYLRSLPLVSTLQCFQRDCAKRRRYLYDLLICMRKLRRRSLTVRIRRRAAFQALKETTQSTPCRQCPYPQANSGIFSSLRRHNLNRRSTMTSFNISPMVNTVTPVAIWPVPIK